ncbi:MAG TPA: cytochrome ubiquinol oxidase subunit I [Amycolatopsis sp.]|uniref:cytochrome ubiquinol oxidase subunit I n=1 Tax=Amycolatopsis sp. TaxID=37632 RepID=UPI002B48C443|nr:cytochrome ubiquinol oxidase subunit I [Amycolatopsis sp.]HKS47293.1 cytochrome ubiquinol oxidase subunit I [Amycolatopsis sp.]
MRLLTAAAAPLDLVAARQQMAVSLGWHIVLACLGVGMPALVLFAEWRGLRTGDEAYAVLARRWAKAMGVLFAVGAVSGTILSFELGLLWPGMMGVYGQVIGLPFTLEGIAFFLEAIFLGIYLYAWDRLRPRVHLATGIPIVLAGIASAFFVVSANAWMNQPRGFTLADGAVTQVDPWAAMFNPATGPESVHMILAAFMVSGYLIAGVYAAGMLRGRQDRHHRLGLLIPLTAAAIVTPLQLVAGDYIARFLASAQPAKLAALEGVYQTGSHVPLVILGIPVNGELRYGLPIPNGLSLLVGYSPDTVITGLEQFPMTDWAPVGIVHLAFDIMIGIGVLLLLLGVWQALAWWRRRDLPKSRWFLRFAAISGVLACCALEAGWVTTEVGRQPWIVWGLMRTADAVNPAPGLATGLVVVLAVYMVMTIGTIAILRLLARTPRPIAPQEAGALP